MKKSILLSGAALFLFGWAQAEIFTVYSDKGISGDQVFTWPNEPFRFDGQSTAIPAAEGARTFRTLSSPSAGWGVFYVARPALDLSRFANGYLRFWLYSDTGNIRIEIERTGGSKSAWSIAGGWDPSQHANRWINISIPLAGVPLTNVMSPIQVTADSAGTFYVDQVRYVDAAACPGCAVFDVSVVDIGSQAPASNITWSGAALPAGWVRADQMLLLDVDPDSSAWGVQVYTDNTEADASPRFVGRTAPGERGSNPAGLIDTVSAGDRLPMAWSVKGGTYTAPSAEDPSAGTPDSFQWLYLKDRLTPAIAAENTTAFANGDYYVTPVSNRGIQFGPRFDEFGSENPPWRIYLEADFTSAVTPRTYRTSKLYAEFFRY